MGGRVRADHGIVLTRGGRAVVHLGLIGQDRRPGGVKARVALLEDVFHGLMGFDDASVQDFLRQQLVGSSILGQNAEDHEP